MSTTKMLLGGGLVLAALFSGGTAYTAGTGQPATQTLGYGSTTVSNAAVDSMTYVRSRSGTDDQIDEVDLVLHGDLTQAPTPTVKLGFNGALETDMYICVAGTFASSATPFVCTVDDGPKLTKNVTSTQVLVVSANA